LTRAAPVYPREELRRGISGWVILAYDLDGSGKAVNIRHVDSEPREVFVASAAVSIVAQKFTSGVVERNSVNIITFTTE
jgi:outer membrane biosynthesis protein TonB